MRGFICFSSHDMVAVKVGYIPVDMSDFAGILWYDATQESKIRY